MWKLNDNGTHAKNKRADCTAFVTATVIVNGEYETRIESMHDTLDEAKAALSKFVATENAEEAKDLWQIDNDGNAFSPDGKIFRLKLPPNGLVSDQYIIVKKTKGVFDSTEFLSFAEDLNASCQIIESFADKLNDEICDTEDD